MAAVKKVFLIAGASSKNGTSVAKLLLAEAGNKYIVRVGARDPTKLSALVALGAEAVVLDSSLESAFAAFNGVDGVFIVLPFLAGGVEDILIENYLKAAKETGTKHIVYLSAIDADVKSSHNHKKYEQLVSESGIPFTILRPAWFHENAVSYYAETIKSKGVFWSSAGDGVFTSVAVADISAAAVAALTEPEKHVGQTYTLTGESVTEKQVAETISKIIGKPVTHVNLSPEEYEALMTQFTGSKEYAAALVLLDKNRREGHFAKVDPALEQIIGRKPISLHEVLTNNASAFKEA
ncbi:unnamed protein product [Sphagnum troendelagicum]|uniref:NmrA-like domain-containing protein n=1 Tax=Sphagnum troendelagicum TaxID=128251 RepID=A0ABP0TWW2_9BRYO